MELKYGTSLLPRAGGGRFWGKRGFMYPLEPGSLGVARGARMRV